MQTRTSFSNKTKRLVQLAILAAIVLIFAFTPIGYLRVGAIEITFIVIPVAIGAIMIGPTGGAVLGALFGITSFLQCFGTSAFGAFMLGLDPILTFVICLVPRVLCGWLSGLLFRALARVDKTKLVSFFASALATPLLNTAFFIGSILLFFWRNEAFLAKMAGWGIPTDSILTFFVAFVGVNGLVEAIVSFVVSAAVAKALVKLIK